MPYKREGKNVLHFKNGKWSVKQTCKTPAAANRAIRLMNAIEHGYKPK
jgi:hypothetical protein